MARRSEYPVSRALKVGVFLAVVVLAVAVAFAVMSPSCAERGGELKFSHYQTVYVNNMPTMHPVYRCEGEWS